MPDIALRGVPEGMHRELKSAAKRNHRSVNEEIIARLKASFDLEPVDVGALPRRIRIRGENIGQIDLSNDTLREMRNAGRR